MRGDAGLRRRTARLPAPDAAARGCHLRGGRRHCRAAAARPGHADRPRDGDTSAAGPGGAGGRPRRGIGRIHGGEPARRSPALDDGSGSASSGSVPAVARRPRGGGRDRPSPAGGRGPGPGRTLRASGAGRGAGVRDADRTVPVEASQMQARCTRFGSRSHPKIHSPRNVDSRKNASRPSIASGAPKMSPTNRL